jgi:hypothetical protein
VGTCTVKRLNYAQCVALCRAPPQSVGVSTKVSTTASQPMFPDSQLFDWTRIILLVLTRGILLPKQMLYQAELRPDRDRPRTRGAGSLAGLRPDATQCGGLRHKFLRN